MTGTGLHDFVKIINGKLMNDNDAYPKGEAIALVAAAFQKCFQDTACLLLLIRFSNIVAVIYALNAIPALRAKGKLHFTEEPSASLYLVFELVSFSCSIPQYKNVA